MWNAPSLLRAGLARAVHQLHLALARGEVDRAYRRATEACHYARQLQEVAPYRFAQEAHRLRPAPPRPAPRPRRCACGRIALRQVGSRGYCDRCTPDAASLRARLTEPAEVRRLNRLARLP